jgi:hypothetical protein
VGAFEEHGLSDIAERLFGKRRVDVEADWEKVIGQLNSLIDRVAVSAKSFSLDEITFELGFSAEGQIVFVAKAGVQTTIIATFKRKA